MRIALEFLGRDFVLEITTGTIGDPSGTESEIDGSGVTMSMPMPAHRTNDVEAAVPQHISIGFHK